MDGFVRYFQTAGITVKVISDYEITDQTFDTKFNAFQIGGPGNENIIVRHIFNTPVPEYQHHKKIFEDPLWRIFKTKTEWFYEYTPPEPCDFQGPVIGIFSPDHSETSIYAPGVSKEQYQRAGFASLTLFNTDQVLFARLLNDRQGIVLHANGFDVDQRGILLTGESGAGKSTLSGMLKKAGATILCDDRMFVRKLNRQFMLYGNWNHGSVPDVSSGCVPLNAIFFLEQSKDNQIIKIENKQRIAIDLFQSVVKQFLTKPEWQVSFDTLEKLIQEVDCFRICFNLDGGISPQIKNLMNTYPTH